MNYDYKLNSTQNMEPVVYAPGYHGSADGILELEDNIEFDFSSYMMFNNVEYKTIDDFIQVIQSLLEKNAKIKYNISVDINEQTQSAEILITSADRYLKILIPKRQSEINIIREYLFKEAVYHGVYYSHLTPLKNLDSIELDIRNLFI